ncbi:MAG TPA: SPFH domain-containing protein [Gemmatimonadaceae bacterium]|nr:SPFH domain-containing protein [Gemmatimonadaceae bacterium]
MIREVEYKATPGLMVILVLVVGELLALGAFVRGAQQDSTGQVILALVVFTLLTVFFKGIFVVNPNEAKVITLFGRYIGSEKRAGLWFANPFTARKRISLRVRNFETTKLKVNDANSNPIEIGAIVVWNVVETAEAMFEVDNYEEYVRVQSEAALRTLATHYPYDAHEEGGIALSTHIDEVSARLAAALKDRLHKAGVEVIEARISHLAYAPEIAAAMLRRQQASAIIAARKKIVEGAVGMVEHALELLSKAEIVTLDEDRKAAMVSNLLVVLCSDHDAQPVVNAGTIYQ